VNARVVFYTRRGCHLCEELRERLRARGLDPGRWPTCDVDRDPEARARFGPRLPVLTLDGRVVLEGRADEPALARLVRLLDAASGTDGGGPAR
jgi:hypothetical protein